jgi:threonine dehydrogenase-like Zn-dependent dehydrogenase
MSVIERYRRADAPLPQRMHRWHLYGAGLENLGCAGKSEEVPMPEYGSNELLVRQDACGLCFSDTKVINLGSNHPRMNGRDLSRDPVTLGHEVACTVVGVGADLAGRFAVGERFVVQADVFYRGESLAYGYAIKGGLAEYSVIPQAIIEGDEGCYLLPVASETGYAEAALVEPWACVVSAYAQAHRDGVLAGGALLVIGSTEAKGRVYDWNDLLTEAHRPNHMITYALTGSGADDLAKRAAELQIPLMAAGDEDWNKIEGSGGFDDVVILGNPGRAQLEAAARCLKNHGILNIVCESLLTARVALDIGRIHYNWHHYIGTVTNRPGDAYAETRTAELAPGGIAWFIGAGGPMGQMHVQRAVLHLHPPRRIVATDVDPVRLASITERFGSLAKERGIDLVALNPNELGDDMLGAELERLGEGRGYDDIVSMAPSAAVTEQAARYLAAGGWFNIFAGVARGTMAELNLNRVVHERCRFVGSSGSSLADMRATLARVECRQLSTNASLAAIGGLNAAAEGLRAVKEGRFAGKTLIFPQISDLPLCALSDLKETLPTVYARLQDGKFWTVEAEEELLRWKLAQE